MRQMTADEQMDLFDDDDWGSLSDSVMNAGGQPLDRPALRRIYAALPDDIRDNVMHWGMSDTPTRERIFEFLERHPEIREAAASEDAVRVEQEQAAAEMVAWVAPHQRSEEYALLGRAALLDGRLDDAKIFFSQSANAEMAALAQVDDSKSRIFGTLAVRVVHLWRLAGDNQRALMTAHLCLVNPSMPESDRSKLDSAVMDIYLERPAKVELVLQPALGLEAEQTSPQSSLAGLSDAEIFQIAERSQQALEGADPLTMELARRLQAANERIASIEQEKFELREMMSARSMGD